MTVFKTFWKIVNKYKGTIILYTVMLISFGGINLASNDTTTTFTSTLPNIAIVNNDQKSVLTNNLISYLSENSKVVDIENDEEKINDALFYRDVSYVVYIPKNYTNDVLKGMNPTIDIKSTNDYTSSLEEMMLTDYLNLQNTYLKLTTDQTKLTNYINDTLKDKSEVVLTSKVDTKSLSKVSRYFNFASYSILAVVIFIITLVLTSFKEKTVNNYFEFLAGVVSDDRFGKNVTYRRLLMHLHTIEFRWTIKDDSNRANDGVSMRWRFAQETGRERYYEEISECLAGPCTVLEMLVALAVKCEENIMDDPNYGNRTGQWFWKMITNLGLSTMYNNKFDKKIVNIVIEKFLDREDEPNGQGGLFVIRNCRKDLREVPIWQQLCWYLDNFS